MKCPICSNCLNTNWSAMNPDWRIYNVDCQNPFCCFTMSITTDNNCGFRPNEGVEFLLENEIDDLK